MKLRLVPTNEIKTREITRKWTARRLRQWALKCVREIKRLYRRHIRMFHVFQVTDGWMKSQESVQMYCVKEQMTDGDGKNFKMGFQDWDIIGQGTASLTTIAHFVKQAEGDKYVTCSLVLPFINTCMKSLQKMVVLSNRGLALARFLYRVQQGVLLRHFIFPHVLRYGGHTSYIIRVFIMASDIVWATSSS